MEMHDAGGDTRFMEEDRGQDNEQEGEDDEIESGEDDKIESGESDEDDEQEPCEDDALSAYGHSADAVIPLWELYNVEAVSSARLV